MNDGWSTRNLFVAAAIHMTYGDESWTGVDLHPMEGTRNEPEFQFDIASCDGAIIEEDFEQGQLSIADLKALMASYFRITGQMKSLVRRNETKWVSPSWQRQWIQGRRDDGRRIK
jgi:hypothetical protein